MGIAIGWMCSSLNRTIYKYKLKRLFKNQFSDVYIDKSKKYILKQFKSSTSSGECAFMYNNEKFFLNMFKDMEKVKKHVPKIIDFDDNERFILMESKGDDGIILINNNEYNKEIFEEFLKQIPSVLEQFFKAGYAHRDIKPENMVYDKKTNTWSIIDFAFMEPLKLDDKTKLPFRGTYPYSAPFLGNRQLYNKFLENNKLEDIKMCADVYSFAISAFSLEGNEHFSKHCDYYVELSLRPVYETIVNPYASQVKKALASIILACVDTQFTTITWNYHAPKGRHCSLNNHWKSKMIENIPIEKNVIKCWENFLSIISGKQNVKTDTAHVQTEN